MNAEHARKTATYVRTFEDVAPTDLALAGGKGAHLGELSRLDGVRVPAGFCVTTDAFRRILPAASIDEALDRLSRLKPGDHEAVRVLSAEIRRSLEAIAVPDDVRDEIARALARLGEHGAYAVRSSATAEDSTAASFAGQHDTYLNVVGTAAVVEHVRRCWASLFTERAVAYRLRAGLDQRRILMAVVVQRMVFPKAAGVLFTADPVTGHRKVSTLEAVTGLGEAHVSGLVNADVFKVRDGAIFEKKIAAEIAVLTDAEVVSLAEVGRRIEAHFGRPRDVEWCLAGDDFHIVQSRPITTLFPIPSSGDGENRVYVSVGHGQMMTDAMKPLGLSLFQRTALAPMHEAGGRLFVDVTRHLASAESRRALLALLGKTDPRVQDALQTIVDRGDFLRLEPDGPPAGAAPAPPPPPPLEADPAIVTRLIAKSEASITALKRDIQGRSGPALFDFILADIPELRRRLSDPESHRAIMAGMEATWWLDERLHAWLGEKNAAAVLTQSVPHNVTSEMGLALLDVADAIRPHPEVVAFLEQSADDDLLDRLPELAGGREARDALERYLDAYGMRCVGEIDITRPRFRERPRTLVPVLLGLVHDFQPGAGARRFEQGRLEAERKEAEVLERLRALPDGERKAEETKGMIDRVRTFMGYREYPKYGLVCRYFIYKQALMAEAERLVRAGVLEEKEDAFHLTFDELHEVARTNHVDEALLRRRKEIFPSFQALTPPRVITSDGEIVSAPYRRDGVPDGALVGLPVSAGVVEGRARVILDIAEADLEPGDILVTSYTDPSFTPLFVAIEGLVTEVGGLMTHGSVIAREYGLPAVVGVENATRLIRDGQRIRVHGADGYVEILADGGLS